MDRPTVLELTDDDGRVTRWTVPELTTADVADVVRQHGEELVECPDCDGGYLALLPMPCDTRRTLTVKCATCEGAGQLARADLWTLNDQEDR